MLDSITSGLLILAAGGIFGMFIRIEHRLTKVETTVTHIREHMTQCPPCSDNDTK